jgi:hypothetical protein
VLRTVLRDVRTLSLENTSQEQQLGGATVFVEWHRISRAPVCLFCQPHKTVVVETVITELQASNFFEFLVMHWTTNYSFLY